MNIRFSILLLSFFPFLAHAADWPIFFGQSYDGYAVKDKTSSNIGKKKPKKIWESQIYTGYSSMTIANNKVYTMGHKGGKDIIYCLDVDTGKQIWTHSYSAPLTANLYQGGPNATPTVHEGRVYTIGKEGEIFCLGANDGKVLWKKNLKTEMKYPKPEWGYAGSGFIYKDTVIFNAGKNGIALNLKSGKVKWASGKQEAGYAMTIPYKLKGKDYLAVFGAADLYSVNPDNGDVLWNYRWKTKYKVNSALPLIVKDKIFISSAYSQGCALLKIGSRSAQKIWSNKKMQNHFNTSILKDNKIYGFSGRPNKNRGSLRCMDLSDGSVLWEKNGLGTGSLISAGGKLIILSEKGELIIANPNPKAYSELQRIKILNGECWTSPAFANGKVFARCSEGQIVCYDING